VPVVLRRYPIAYYPTPKVACTSIKLALYELEYEIQFETRQAEDGTWVEIHGSWQGTPSFSPVAQPESYYKFAVVRDPLQRFLSAYANRVVHHGELAEKHLCGLAGELIGLRPNPSLSEFIDRLDLYRRASESIRHHTDPQIYFLGKNLSYYNKIFCFSELSEIVDALRAAVGAEIKLLNEQSGGPKLSRKNLNKEEQRKIVEFYAEDYLLLRDFYSFD
jgi:hypothetical protein